MMADMRSAALAYAERGWRVHPLRPASKLPGLNRWQEKATADSATIQGWLESDPDSNIGIATGAGLLVLDVDTKNRHDGHATLAGLQAQHGVLPRTFTVRTPSGGTHFYFATLADVRNSAGKLGDGLDIRGAGGYVVAPPSVTPAGCYEVICDVPPAPAPDWLLAAATRPATKYAQAAIDRACRRIASAPEGERNETLNREAFGALQLAAAGELPEADTRAKLEQSARCNGLSQSEIAATLRSAGDAAARSPRSTPVQQDAEGAPTLTIADLAGFDTRELPPPSFAVDSIVPRGEVTLFGAHGGSGKSILGETITALFAASRPFGPFAVAGGRCAFVSLEDPPSVVLYRLRNIVAEYQLNAEAVARNLLVIDGTEGDAALVSEAAEFGARRLTETANLQTLRELVQGCRLIVVDNASDAFDANENERRAVRGFVRKLAHIGRTNDAGVLLLAHIDKDAAKHGARNNSYSGSTAWHNSARSRLALAVTDGRLELIHEKAQYGKLADPLALRWTATGVLIPANASQARASDAVLAQADAEGVLRALHAAQAAGCNVPPGRVGSATAYTALRTFTELPAALRDPRGRARFWEALDALLREGRAECAEYKTPDRKTRMRVVPERAE